jgi:hypothetical protein
MSEFDYTTLAAYLDGELDRPTMLEVEAYLDRDADARRHVIEALHATILLRAAGREMLAEGIPPRLVETIHKPVIDRPSNRPFPRRPFRHLGWWSSLRPALALTILILGVGLGLFFRTPASGPAPSSFPALPAAYLQAVNESLENHRSGEPLILGDKAPGQRIVVTPTRTYRHRNGQYFRDYRLDIYQGDEHRQLNGLAIRTGKRQWSTTAIFYPDEANRL